MGIIKASKLIFDYIRHDEEEKAVEVDRAIDGLSLDIAKGSFVAKLFVCPDLSAQLFALETGLGVMVLNENHTALQNPHLVARSLEGLPTAKFCIAWHGANPNPAVQLFLQQL